LLQPQHTQQYSWFSFLETSVVEVLSHEAR
jgi:hypothetical protein